MTSTYTASTLLKIQCTKFQVFYIPEFGEEVVVDEDEKEEEQQQ